jgi:L-malate glycosyltransferase
VPDTPGVSAGGYPNLEVHQFLPAFALPDAVGNHTMQMHRMLSSEGISGAIWAEMVLFDAPEVRSFKRYRRRIGIRRRSRRVLLYQASTGSMEGILDAFLANREPKTAYYHNITPAEFFAPYDPGAAETLRRGRQELHRLAAHIRVATAASEYNALELHNMGVEDVRIVPPYMSPAVIAEPNQTYLTHLRMTKRGSDLLSVGRVVPHKGHLQLLRAFAAFRKEVDPKARLFIIGPWGPRPYMDALFKLRDALRLEGVAFTGSVSAPVLVAHYRTADVFVTMSEHEGFGLPLIEAMRFDLPVIAYDSGAVAETLDGAGVLVRTLDAAAIAELIARLTRDERLLTEIRWRQRERLAELTSVPRDKLHLAAILKAAEAA